MMRLPESLEQKPWQDIKTIEGETKVRYVTSVERRATERGKQQGIHQGIQQACIKAKLRFSNAKFHADLDRSPLIRGIVWKMPPSNNSNSGPTAFSMPKFMSRYSRTTEP